MTNKSFARWYVHNKKALAAKRKERYLNDPTYREKVLTRAREARAKNKNPIVVPVGYACTMIDVSKELGITIWTLREWRKKNYFPEPYSSESRLWFTQNQISLLHMIKEFFDTHGKRVSADKRPGLESLISVVYSNWG